MARRTSAKPAATPPGSELDACVQAQGVDACLLRVHVVPNASRTIVAGLHDGALRVRLAAPPIEGRANEALLRWLTGELGLPRRAAVLEAGDTSRRKTVRLGCPADAVRRWLAAMPAD